MRARRPITAALLAPVLAYRRWVSPAIPPRCRFLPTCSAYAEEALQVHGAGHGTWLVLRRLARCHPFHAGGIDLVPPVPARPSILHAGRRDTGALL